MQALPTLPESVCLVEMQNSGTGGNLQADETQLFLHVGLNNGVILRTAVDNVTGILSDSRTRFLGTKGVKLYKCFIQGQPAMIALSSRPWICYNYLSTYMMTPLSYEMLESASNFCSEQCPDGMVAITGNTLRILTVEKLGDIFNHTVIPLTYTPRKMIFHPETKFIITIETEHQCYTTKERQDIKKEIFKKTGDEEYMKMSDSLLGYPKAPEGKWASLIRIMEPYELKTIKVMEFEENESCFQAFISTTLGAPGETYLFLGTAKDFTLNPRSCQIGYIYCFIFTEGGRDF
jgi:splicing factor 3B subunit 3